MPWKKLAESKCQKIYLDFASAPMGRQFLETTEIWQFNFFRDILEINHGTSWNIIWSIDLGYTFHFTIFYPSHHSSPRLKLRGGESAHQKSSEALLLHLGENWGFEPPRSSHQGGPQIAVWIQFLIPEKRRTCLEFTKCGSKTWICRNHGHHTGKRIVYHSMGWHGQKMVDSLQNCKPFAMANRTYRERHVVSVQL